MLASVRSLYRVQNQNHFLATTGTEHDHEEEDGEEDEDENH